jgi:hypothetical protein
MPDTKIVAAAAEITVKSNMFMITGNAPMVTSVVSDAPQEVVLPEPPIDYKIPLAYFLNGLLWLSQEEVESARQALRAIIASLLEKAGGGDD